MSEEEVNQESEFRSTAPFILFLVFFAGIVLGVFLYTHPEVSLLSSLLSPSLSNRHLSSLGISPSSSALSLELTEYDSIESQLYKNPQAEIKDGKVIITLEPNELLKEEAKVDYTTIDKDEALCDKYKTYYSTDILTEKFDCLQIKEDLTKIVEIGIPTYTKGYPVETKTIDEKITDQTTADTGAVAVGGLEEPPIEEPPIEEPKENLTAQIVTYTFDASNLQAGDTFQIGDHSIVFTVVATSSNIFNVNTTTEPNNITHLLPSTNAPYNSLVAYYSFDSDEYPLGGSNGTAYDFTNNNLDGTYASGATLNTSSQGCIYDNCAGFDGVNDYISLSTTESLLGDNTRNWTVMSWAKTGWLSDGNSFNFIYGEGRTNAENEAVFLRMSNGTGTNNPSILIRNSAGTTVLLSSTDNVVDNNWHHITATKLNDQYSLYVDGVLKSSASSALGTIDNTKSAIGASGRTPLNNFINGSIDEVMIFNASLNSSQVLQIYQNTSQRFNPTGTATIKFQNITADGNNTINLSVSILENNYDTNNSVRIGSWNVSQGYDNINESLVFYAHFDNSVNDSSRNNINGTAQGDLGFSNGQFNNSLFLDGTLDYVNYSDVSFFDDASKPVSFSFWVNPRSITDQTYQQFIDKLDNSNVGWTIDSYAQTGKLLFAIRSNGWLQVSSTSTLSNNRWTHAVITYDGTKAPTGVKFYLNGLSDTPITVLNSLSADDISNSIPMMIGDRGVSTGLSFNGSLDEIMIWNKTLSANEIKELYVKGRTGNVGVNWSYGNYSSIPSTNTNVSLSFTPYATNILPEILQIATPTTQFYTSLFGGTIRMDSYQTAGAPVDNPPVVTFNTPANGTTTVNNPIFYAYNHTDDTALKNTTHYLWNASGIVSTNYSAITGVANFTNLSMAFSNQGVYLFNAYTCDSLNQCAWATVNRSIYYDTMAPALTSMTESPSDPATYSPNQFYEFNITVVEATSNIGTVVIEFNGVNYSSALNQVLNRGNGNYSFNRTDLGAGTYNYYWFANDSAGNNNRTGVMTYTINKATPTVTLTIDGFATNRTVLAGVAVSLNASQTIGQGVIQLITIGNIIGQAPNSVINSTIFTGSGSKNVTAFYPASQNYSAGSLTRWVDLLSTGGSICGVSASATRLNATTIQILSSSWDTDGTPKTYTLGGVCRDGAGNTISFPTFSTLSTGNYEAVYATAVGGSCNIIATDGPCSQASTSWLSYFGSGTTSSSSACVVNATSLLSKSNTRPYGQLCSRVEFK